MLFKADNIVDARDQLRKYVSQEGRVFIMLTMDDVWWAIIKHYLSLSVSVLYIPHQTASFAAAS